MSSLAEGCHPGLDPGSSATQIESRRALLLWPGTSPCQPTAGWPARSGRLRSMCSSPPGPDRTDRNSACSRHRVPSAGVALASVWTTRRLASSASALACSKAADCLSADCFSDSVNGFMACSPPALRPRWRETVCSGSLAAPPERTQTFQIELLDRSTMPVQGLPRQEEWSSR